MNCQNIAEILDEGDTRNLSAAERRALEVHIAGCEECRAAFAAHEAMGAMVLPAMSPDLEEQCCRLVVARTASSGRRVGGRPFVVVGLLLAGVAAAAFLGLNLVGGSGGDPELPELVVTTADSNENVDEPAALPPPESGEALAGPGEPAPDAPGAAGFTVGIGPLRQGSAIPEVIRITETVYRAFLDELRRIPNIELVMISPDELASTGAPAGWWYWIGDDTAVPSSARIPTSGNPAVSGALRGIIEFEPASVANVVTTFPPPSDGTATQESRTLVLVDSRRPVQAGSDEEVDLSTMPTALVARMAEVTGGASAAASAEPTAGVVNVIFDNNIDGVRVDMSYNTTAGSDAAMLGPELLAYDVLLNATGSSRPGSNAWIFTVNARSRSAGRLSTSVSEEIGEAVDPSAFVKQLIVTLQAEIFPVDEALLAAITAKVLDRGMPVDEWLDELNRLKQMTGRAGQTRLSDDVARAIADMSTRITDPRQLSSFISALQGLDNAVLVQPLANVLRNSESDGIRLEAAIQLAGFRRDPVARAALDAAASADPSPDVRLNARWAALDEAGHRNLIVASLLDTRLTDAERIEPLLLDLGWAQIEPVDLGSAVDATVVNELSQLLRRHEPAATRARVLGRLSREDSQVLTPLFIERLRDDEAEVVRTAAATALGQRLDEPVARQALERATIDDPSPGVRQTAARWLEGPAVVRELVIRN